MGHRLTIAMRRWQATVSWSGGEPAAAQLTVETRSLEVLHGEGGIKALSGPEKAVVRSNALRALGAERYPQIRFATESIEQVHDGYRLAGMLHIHGMTRRRMIDVNTQDVGHSWRVSAQARVRQTDFGVKPYSLLMGAVKVADEVTVSFTADRVKAG